MGLFVGIKIAWDIQRKNNELELMKVSAQESELRFLRSQINPHFLFNNLNNLYAHALEESPKTPAIILELSSLLRYMLYDSKGQYVDLKKELKYLTDFVHLQELQIENRGKIDYKIRGTSKGLKIAPLILIVFVENCFKHSSSSQSSGIEIEIDIRIVESRLYMYCSNTFSLQKNTDQLSRGIGMNNVRSRLQMIYPNAYQLSVQQSTGLYEVHLEIDLNQGHKSLDT